MNEECACFEGKRCCHDELPHPAGAVFMAAVKCMYGMIVLLTMFGLDWGTAQAEDFIFETSTVRLVIDDSGSAKSMRERTGGRELLAGSPAPLFSVRRAGKWNAVTKLAREGGNFRAQFGQSGMSADLRISAGPDRVVIELVRLDAAGAEEVRLAQVRAGGLPNSGVTLTVLWDALIAISLMGLSDKVDSRFGEGMLLASVYPEFGMLGEKVALVTVPTQQFSAAVQRVEKEFGLPSPMIGGVWAKASSDVRTSYLFTDLTEANADDTIRYAKRAGFRYIMIYSHIWSSSLGSYPINLRSFPRGEEGLKTVIDKCHAAGLKVGMHVMTSFVGKDDAFASARVRHLFSDAGQVLSRDIGASDREVPAEGSLSKFLTGAYGPAKDLRVDDEIIRCETAGGPGSTVLMQCQRGYAGTRPAFHKAGAKLQHLAEYSGFYLADLRTPLKEEIAERISGVIDRCGFDMIFFDGAEVNCINGPCWHWAGQQELSITKRVKRDLLIEGSGMSHWGWHMTTRGYCSDFAAVAPKQYLDHHKIDYWWNFYFRSFMPVELGWWGVLTATPDHPATTPDEAELYAVRMLALNTPVSIETTLDALRSNGRTEEMLAMLGRYEELRLGDVVPSTIREQLRTGEWHLTNKDGRRQFSQIRYQTVRSDESGEVLVRNEFAPQRLKFRLQAVPALTMVGNRSNIALLPPGSQLVLNKPGPTGVSPGMLAGRILFTQAGAGQPASSFPGRGSSTVQGSAPPNLMTHRALALNVKTEGMPPKAGEKGAVLNVQLESGGLYRDHYIDLDFIGERAIIIAGSNTERMLPELRPSYTTYAINAAMSGFNYQSIDAVNFRWMQQSRTNPLKATVTLVEALSETDALVKDPEITVGRSRVVIPGTLKTGDYVEYWGDGPARIFDRNGRQLSTTEVVDAPVLSTGENKMVVTSKGIKMPVKVTTILLGKSLSF
ncbi:MAG: hypothetical protein EPN25_06560 [Nitrospirae bacterium]|nr:MAG: hypothetical protein EPN25_06560 [Nitrospirota bacterium]